jgi:2-polyprenyl-3-methyl-5-hydroxy-6-metoxy-1,4-benzoquinol methylase
MTNDLSLCDLCQFAEFEIIGHRDRDGQPLQTKLCKRCGLVAHRNLPTEEELQQYYATTYRLDYNGESTPSTRRVMRAWKNGERILRQIGPLLPKGGRVLEVGAGIGCTVKVFERAGFRAEGIDPGGEFLNYSRQRLNAQVEVGDLYDLPETHQFDAVLLVHVIEHLASPRKALNKIATLLKPGGLLYVECPNLEAPFARRDRLFHVAHIHNFIPASLEMLANSCGFEVDQRFGDQQDPNLQRLLRYTGECKQVDGSQNYGRVLEALRRANWGPYHLRWRYVSQRLQKLFGYVSEHLTSRRFVAQRIAECASSHLDQSAQLGSALSTDAVFHRKSA